jgi:hypothetical protein
MQASMMNALRYAEFAGNFYPVCAGSAMQRSKASCVASAAIFYAAFTISNSTAIIAQSASLVSAAVA